MEHKHNWKRGVKSFPVRGGESQTYQYICTCEEQRYAEPNETKALLRDGLNDGEEVFPGLRLPTYDEKKNLPHAYHVHGAPVAGCAECTKK